MKTFRIGGIHPVDNKLGAELHSEVLPVPKQVCVMVSQHLGAPSKPIVQKGDRVKVGQLLTENTSYIGSNVHAPVSGVVSKIDMALDCTGYRHPAIFIDVEGDEWIETIDRSTDIKKEITATKEEIIAKVREMGVVGLGGAAFPTQIKLEVPKEKHVEFFIVNAVECEPFLTDDYRLMLEKPEECMIGIAIMQKVLGVKHAYIGIENNKKDVVKIFKELARNYPGIEIFPLQVKYPQGSEKQLIYALTKREVPSGKLPIDAGCIVNNISTCFAVYEAVQKNKPIVERMVTITGKKVKKPSNHWIRIGSPISMLIEAGGGMPENTGKIIIGGPMMGKAATSVDIPVMKNTSAVLLIPQEESIRKPATNCIRCAKCSEACPIGLEPHLVSALVRNENWERAEEERIMDCIECGCCLYTCPSYIPLLDLMRLGKMQVRQKIHQRSQTK